MRGWSSNWRHLRYRALMLIGTLSVLLSSMFAVMSFGVLAYGWMIPWWVSCLIVIAGCAPTAASATLIFHAVDAREAKNFARAEKFAVIATAVPVLFAAGVVGLAVGLAK